MAADAGNLVVRLVPNALLMPLLAAGTCASAVYGMALLSGDEGIMRLANSSLPALLGIVCLYCSYSHIRQNPGAFWTPLQWFLAAWATYYGLGPLSYVYGTPDTVAFMDMLYPVDERALLRTNLLNTIALMAVLIGATVMSRVRIGDSYREARPDGHSPWRVALLFLAIGSPIKYLFELPYVLGLTDNILPGTIMFLGSFSGLAIVPLTLAKANGWRHARILLWIVIASEIAVGILMLAKLHIIKTVLLILLGQYVIRPSFKRFVLMGVLIAVSYVAVLSPFVNFGRVILGRSSAVDFSEVATVTEAYGSQGRQTLADVLPGVQGWWARLSYTNTQAYAMNQYDTGSPGWTFGMVVYTFAPRFIFTDKPTLTPGTEFNYLIQGTTTASTGLGFAGEAYWNGGWLSVIFTGILVGVLFSVLGRLTVNSVNSNKWLYMPLIFGSIYLGLRPDDWLVPAYVSNTIQIFITIFLLNFCFSNFVRSTRAKSGKDMQILNGKSVANVKP